MAKVNPLVDKDGVCFGGVYRGMGYHILTKHENYNKAIKYFDKAVQEDPFDTDALAGRAKARSKAALYKKALEDNAKLLTLAPECIGDLSDRALILNRSSEFEQSLVESLNLLEIRQFPDDNRIGAMQCRHAIENGVGDLAGRPLRDHFKIIRNLWWRKYFKAQKNLAPQALGRIKKKNLERKKLKEQEHLQLQPKVLPAKIQKAVDNDALLNESEPIDSIYIKSTKEESVPNLVEPFPFKPIQNYTSNIENFMSEKYLDSMYLDKIFLKSLESANGAVCLNEKGSLKIKQLAKRCYADVYYKQEVLRTRRPFYFVRYQEKKAFGGSFEKRMNREREHYQRLIKSEADALLNNMFAAYAKKELQPFLVIAEKLKELCDSKTKNFFPTKSLYLHEIYDKVCKAYYHVYRVNESDGKFQQTRMICGLIGIELGDRPVLDTSAQNVFLNYQKKINFCNEKLKRAVVLGEICWLYHELARYHLETKQFDLARCSARNGIRAAKVENNYMWVFSFWMAIVKSYGLQHNKHDAKINLMNAKECAQLLNDKEKVQFIDGCFEATECIEIEAYDQENTITMRKQKIIQMMADSNMKGEVKHLFKQIEAMPRSRRMTIMRGEKVNNDSPKSMKTRRGMSIVSSSSRGPATSIDERLTEMQSESSHALQRYLSL